MANITASQLNLKFALLKREVAFLRSLLSSIAIQDKEGGYKTSFIRKITRAMQEKPDYVFQGSKNFIKSVKKLPASQQRKLAKLLTKKIY